MASIIHSQSPTLGRVSKPSYDFAILISAGLIAIGIVIAVYGLAMSSGASANDLALMVAYP
jgi:hypothetical protein